jgi:hypothetical protein
LVQEDAQAVMAMDEKCKKNGKCCGPKTTNPYSGAKSAMGNQASFEGWQGRGDWKAKFYR